MRPDGALARLLHVPPREMLRRYRMLDCSNSSDLFESSLDIPFGMKLKERLADQRFGHVDFHRPDHKLDRL